MAKLQTVTVNSSNIKSVTYDPDKRELFVEFWGKKTNDPSKTYAYSPITEIAYQELIRAESVGAHFAKHIRSNPNISYRQIN